jgi:hypothetical protein
MFIRFTFLVKVNIINLTKLLLLIKFYLVLKLTYLFIYLFIYFPHIIYINQHRT